MLGCSGIAAPLTSTCADAERCAPATLVVVCPPPTDLPLAAFPGVASATPRLRVLERAAADCGRICAAELALGSRLLLNAAAIAPPWAVPCAGGGLAIWSKADTHESRLASDLASLSSRTAAQEALFGR